MYGMRVVDARFAAIDTAMPATAEEALADDLWTHIPMIKREGGGLQITDFGDGPVAYTPPSGIGDQRLIIDLAARDGTLARVAFINVQMRCDVEDRRLFTVTRGFSDTGWRGEPGFLCPLCLAYSHHPRDVASGYCGRCHAFTVPGRG